MSAELVMYTIYDRPKDFPNSVVVRRWTTGNGVPVPDSNPYIISPSLEQAREALLSVQPGLYCLPRQPGDDPVIVETWL